MNKKAFTLVEILVSMVIFAVLAAGFFSVMTSSKKIISRSKQRLRAAEIARRIIEGNRYLINASVWDNATGPLAVQDWTARDTATYAPYATRYRIDDPGGGAEYRKITVEVFWNETSL